MIMHSDFRNNTSFISISAAHLGALILQRAAQVVEAIYIRIRAHIQMWDSLFGLQQPLSNNFANLRVGDICVALFQIGPWWRLCITLWPLGLHIFKRLGGWPVCWGFGLRRFLCGLARGYPAGLESLQAHKNIWKMPAPAFALLKLCSMSVQLTPASVQRASRNCLLRQYVEHSQQMILTCCDPFF